MRIASIVHDSIVDGQGLRLAVFVQGCSHNCKGCHNLQSHDPKGGYEESIETIVETMKNEKLIDGLTLSGGEPFEQALSCARIAKEAKKLGLSVWTYTGYTWEDIQEADKPDWNLLLSNIDVLVDGPFIESQKSYELKFKGSRNQRLIDVQKSLKVKSLILYEMGSHLLDKFQVPES